MLKADILPDSTTVAYVFRARPVFDMLKHAAAQLAAFFVLASTGSDAASPDHPLLLAARSAVQEAMEGLRTVTGVPEPASHHHRHLLRAAAAITATLATLQDLAWAEKDEAALDQALHRLKAGWQELHWATAALPGFEMVQLSQSCCAGHSLANAEKRTKA
jgi:hypothetical protein